MLLMAPPQQFHNEIRIWTLLHHRGVDAVPFVGVYSTEAHPFGLVYKYMDGLDLRQYLKNESNVGRLKLVCFPVYPLPLLSVNPLMILDDSWHE